MGIYLNPGNENFKSTLASKIYVDKTGMLSVLNEFIDTGNKYICVSRPRRFGKTIAGEMIAAYYSKGCDSDELFSGLKIASMDGYEKKRNRYNVIKIDLNSEYQMLDDKSKLLRVLTQEIKREMTETFPEIILHEEDSLARSILRIHAATKETFIVIIDEYDVLVREEVGEELFNEYLSFLNGLFKSATLRPAIALAYLTGILPVVRDKVQSKLNNFREYTILNAGKLAEYVGFTDQEVRGLCEEYHVDYDTCRSWYDGYRQHGIEIYNPESVVRCLEEGEFDSYWGQTSSYKVIDDYISMDFAGIKDDVEQMMAGSSVDVNVTGYMNTLSDFAIKDDVFSYLLHVGYLAYDREEKTCHIPNREILDEWTKAIRINDEYRVTNRIIRSSKELLSRTLALDEAAVAKALDVSHIHVTSNRSYNNEDALASAIYLAYIYALNEYTVIKEVTSGKGFADVIYIPLDKAKTAMVIELKRNGTAESGLAQIKERRYFDCLSGYQGNLLLVGINYDEKQKTHSCVIEQFEM